MCILVSLSPVYDLRVFHLTSKGIAWLAVEINPMIFGSFYSLANCYFFRMGAPEGELSQEHVNGSRLFTLLSRLSAKKMTF